MPEKTDFLSISSVSQGHLNVWITCQRKFQHLFIDGLNLSATEQQDKRLLGERFHLLMQQRELGLDVTELAESDPKLQKWLLTFLTEPPTTIAGDRLCEHRRTLELNIQDRAQARCYVITAIYDLLILGDRKAQILDWKTHARPLSFATLQANWQTRLYLYILANTSDYLPEQLSMTYWFANTAESVAIAYDSQQHQQTHQELLRILSEMSKVMPDVTPAIVKPHFEQLPLGSDECMRCEFAYRCQRRETMGSEELLANSLEAYPEVVI
ncbi:PD-(D/E)XK nuclease family protein [Tumidithrix elongata RA019]|uniref:PD-(D/E)XK nuclease family protein n=1 Tax=Tumidithrix elongata BACA0141 TaxID=2716417 RepID=A0AAW9PSS8_9CYAN|nr:PD-(D/E)XK nuclease family protein [Tumidithrix elongata RA019]